MPTHRYATTKSRRARLTVLDDCGTPLIGPRSTLVTGGFQKIETKFDYADGDKFESQDAWGDYDVDEQDDPTLRGADLTMDWSSVSPDTWDVTVGARIIVAVAGDAAFAAIGDSVGYAIGKDTVGTSFAVETWTKVAGQACAGGQVLWLWTCWPWVKGGKHGDETLEKGTTTYQQSGRANGASADWGEGPYATPITTLNEGEVFARRLTLVQPPAVTDGLVALAAL